MYSVFIYTHDNTAGYGNGVLLVAASDEETADEMVENPDKYPTHFIDEAYDHHTHSTFWEFRGKHELLRSEKKGFLTARSYVE